MTLRRMEELDVARHLGPEFLPAYHRLLPELRRDGFFAELTHDTATGTEAQIEWLVEQLKSAPESPGRSLVKTTTRMSKGR